MESPDGAWVEAVRHELRSFNAEANPVFWAARGQPGGDPRPLNVFALDERRAVIGGLLGSTQFAWLRIDIMATAQASRRRGIGSALLARAEDEARARGCRHAYVDTMTYQAPAFDERAGYRIVGRLDDWDSHGHAKLFLVKALA